MLLNKLEKNVTLYRNQFDDFCVQIFGDHRLDRYSLDLDAIMFRVKYMTKHQLDLDKLPELKQEFTYKAGRMRTAFSDFLYEFLCQIITIPEPYKLENIVDAAALNVSIDAYYVKFTMALISDSEEYLRYVDESFPDGEVLNIFPDKQFRFYTDSYNDGIAKAYPELFEQRRQDIVGTGDDADIFVHSLTLQSSERCSLLCSYCVSGDTRVHMGYGGLKRIRDIRVGDEVIAFDENCRKPSQGKLTQFTRAKVTATFKREAEIYTIKSPYLHLDLEITPNHRVLTNRGWVPVGEITNEQIAFRINEEMIFTTSYVILQRNILENVYNIETTTGTYIANGMCVHNCYQFNKSEMRMSFDTAKTFIDHLLNDDYGYINRYNSPALILEFIGGEPLLEIRLTRKIYEYFLQRCYELDHPWFTLHRLSICSNGMQYFDDDVQSFFKDYASQISFNISIDGNKELHDACRVQPNGEGSYDIDITALNHFNRHYTPERNSKMTLSPENISYLYDSVVDFINNGMNVINVNCVFEEGWTRKTAQIEYHQLKKLADYILENHLEHIYIAIFSDKQESRLGKEMDGNFCGGGSASMLAVRPNGQFYPCLRFMPSSVGKNVADLCIGSVQTGMVGRSEESEVIKLLDNTTRRSQTNDICWECPIASDCASCSALSHTVYGTPDKRAYFICGQHISEHLSNVYYWNNCRKMHPEWNIPVRKLVVPDEWALIVVDDNELRMLKELQK